MAVAGRFVLSGTRPAGPPASPPRFTTSHLERRARPRYRSAGRRHGSSSDPAVEVRDTGDGVRFVVVATGRATENDIEISFSGEGVSTPPSATVRDPMVRGRGTVSWASPSPRRAGRRAKHQTRIPTCEQMMTRIAGRAIRAALEADRQGAERAGSLDRTAIPGCR